jgi:hypothetical protein
MAGDEAKALELKNKGNELFKQKKWKGALEQYTLAIRADASNAILFGNRAACYLFLEKYASNIV